MKEDRDSVYKALFGMIQKKCSIPSPACLVMRIQNHYSVTKFRSQESDSGVLALSFKEWNTEP